MGGGKSGSSSKTYNYYGTLAGAVAIGPMDALVSIILDGNEVWPKGTAWAVGITCSVGALYVFDAQTWTCSVQHVATSANAPGSGLEGWAEYAFTRGSAAYDDFSLTASDDTYYGVLRFYWGLPTQTADPKLNASGNDGGVSGALTGDQHPDYEGIAYIVIIDFLLGQEVQSGPNLEIVTRRKPNQSVIVDSAAALTDGQANLAAVAAELLTDQNCLALPATMLDTATFQAVGDYLQTFQAMYGASVLIDSSETVTSLFDKLTQMFDGYIRFNSFTQRIEIGVYQHGVVPTAGTYVTLTADSFTKFPKFTTKSWQETISRATIRFNSRQLDYQQTSVQVDDPRAFFVLGTVREQSLDRPWIARPAQAMTHGTETLRVIGHAQMTGELEVRREIGRAIRAGDYVLVDIDLEPNTNSLYQFFRVTNKKTPPTGPITLQVFADNTLAAVPWIGAGDPVITSAPVIPPVTSFRFLDVPTMLAGERGAVTCLAQRPNNLLVGATLYFDTDPAGSFSSNLGTVSNFAAKGTLTAAVTATARTLLVAVDPAQVDADYFTIQTSDNDAANDVVLAFLVQAIPAGSANAGQVKETAGFQVMEICSVSTQALAGAAYSAATTYALGAVVTSNSVQYVSLAAGNKNNTPASSPTWWAVPAQPIYTLNVLRGRKNTFVSAFTQANTEVWLMPAGLLSFFTHSMFDQLRANRIAGLSPWEAQFRICPFTFVNQLALSDATSEPFMFPLASASAPTLTLTAPASYAPTYAATAYPLVIPLAGTWNDPDGNLVELKVLLRLSSETSDRPISDITFAPTASQDFNTSVSLEQSGTWIIKLIARDSTNLVTERDINVVVTGNATKTCALPQIFDCNGEEIVDISGAPIYRGGYQSGVARTIICKRLVPEGIITLKCSTPGSTVSFLGSAIWNGSQIITAGAGYKIFDTDTCAPFNILLMNSSGVLYTGQGLLCYASAPGYANSLTMEVVISNILKQ